MRGRRKEAHRKYCLKMFFGSIANSTYRDCSSHTFVFHYSFGLFNYPTMQISRMLAVINKTPPLCPCDAQTNSMCRPSPCGNIYNDAQSMYKNVKMLSASHAAGYNEDEKCGADDAVCSTGTAGVEGVRVP